MQLEWEVLGGWNRAQLARYASSVEEFGGGLVAQNMQIKWTFEDPTKC